MTDRQQRIIVYGVCTEFLDINKAVPQGTALGPLLFSIMVNDKSSVDSGISLVIKYADDVTLRVPVAKNNDASTSEVENIQQWAKNN